MIDLEIIARIFQAFALVTLYGMLGFGPGFVTGLLTANAIFGRGKPIYMDLHKQAIKNAAQHNAQWHPSNEKWRK